MAIIGIERLVFAVQDVSESARFFDDFGLERDAVGVDGGVVFLLPEGSRVVLVPHGHAALPVGAKIEGDGVREVIWGVDTQAALDRLTQGVGADRDIDLSDDGCARFLTDFGVPMGLRVFAKRPISCAPDPVNAPGHVARINTHKKWRLRARPKTLAHVVFAIAEFEAGYRFMVERLGFRLSDVQRGFGWYLRADGTNNHHSILLLNASAPLPGMDGRTRFEHANFGVEDVDEIMIGANEMVRKGWQPSHLGLGRHRVDSGLFYYLPCPAGGEAEYGADADYVDDGWVPRDWTNPLFGYAHYVHNLPPFLMNEPDWRFSYITGIEPGDAH
uniref:glyoxalase n=1 Tax=uncultured Sphingomonas sp. TaxID=158754 RepID=UPI0035CB8826